MNKERSLRLAMKRYQNLYGMTEQQSRVYALRHRGKTIEAIARELSITRGAAMSHLSRARKKRYSVDAGHKSF